MEWTTAEAAEFWKQTLYVQVDIMCTEKQMTR